MTDFTVYHSGERREFATGSVCDPGDLQPRPDYISPFALLEVGEHMRDGAIEYGPGNWTHRPNPSVK